MPSITTAFPNQIWEREGENLNSLCQRTKTIYKKLKINLLATF